MLTKCAGPVLVTVVCLAIAAAPSTAKPIGSEGGFTYVKKSKTLADTTPSDRVGAEVNAKCPDGSEPTGGGTSVSSNPAGAFVSASGPRGQSWRSGAWHFGQPKGTVTAWGVCFDDKSEVRVASAISAPINGGASSTGAPDCGTTESVSGGGVLPSGAPEEWWIHFSAPRDSAGDLDSEPDDEWRAQIFHQPTFQPQDALFASVCLKTIKPKYEAQGVAFTEDPLVTASVECPKRKSVAGGGPDVSGAPSATHLVKSQPLDSGDKGKIPDDGWKVTVSNPTLTEIDVVAYAACV